MSIVSQETAKMQWMLTLVIVLSTVTEAAAQNVGECVRLKASSQLGIPLHPEAGNQAVSGRLPDDAVAKITAIDANTGWLHLESADTSGWIIRKYIAAVVSCAPAAAPSGINYVVGCWNLEHFHPSSSRGFPENTRGGPTFPPRTQADLMAMAAMIEAIEARILLLSEIGGREEVDADGLEISRSDGLDQLIALLGTNNFGYVIGKSAAKQRLAILYDKRAVRLNSVCEADFPRVEIQGKSIFERQPLLAHFTFMHGGTPMNDLLVVAVHLASGQHLTANHDAAMEALRNHIDRRRQEGLCFPSNETDVLIAGDFNANRFDSEIELFWNDMEANGWDVLADNESAYSATRLSGVPLALENSRIDYIIISDGLKGKEITEQLAVVHTPLIGNSADRFRAQASDHLPVTTRVKVGNDDDQ
jgi:endonuclease/exonuclease/phosphatase family metal-dependent hydrolase